MTKPSLGLTCPSGYENTYGSMPAGNKFFDKSNKVTFEFLVF